MSFLLDTCVISEAISPKPSKAVLSWLDDIPELQLFLSVLSIGELRSGISRIGTSKRRTALENWFDNDLLNRFDGRILDLDIQTGLAWGDLTGKLATKGKPMPAIDSLIAATALRHGLTLVTRNVDDFTHSGVETVNPWIT
jgi:predicted nucleic acid-binding protein